MSETTVALVARALGAAIVPLLIGWGIAVYQKRKSNSAILPKGPLIIGAVFAIFFAGNSAMKQAAEQSSKAKAVQVMRVEQPANGATEVDLTSEFIEQSATAILNGLKKEVPDFDAVPSSSVVEKNGKRLGVIRFTIGDAVPWITVLGITGDKLIRVTCSASGLADVNLNSPDCRRALIADFGTTIDG